MAAQLSLPSIAASTLGGCGRPGRWWDLLRRDRPEQIRLVEAESPWLGLQALSGKLRIALRIENRVGPGRVRRPLGKLRRRDHSDVEMHVRKAVAAEVRGLAAQQPRLFSKQVEPRGHAIHGVDH